jgi:nucleosome binding factor SPN SPT16 subunit
LLSNALDAHSVLISYEQSGPESLEVDIPFRELEFEGVPFRTNVKLQPTTDCLVHLFDPPFLVVTLSEIEIASLERVQFGLKQFDLIFIFNDFSRTPQHINSIPTKQLDSVKEWLECVVCPSPSSDLAYTFNLAPSKSLWPRGLLT